MERYRLQSFSMYLQRAKNHYKSVHLVECNTSNGMNVILARMDPVCLSPFSHCFCLPLSRRVESSNIKLITIQIELIVYSVHSNVGPDYPESRYDCLCYRYSLQLYITICKAASSPMMIHRNIIKKSIFICAQPQARLEQRNL